MKYFMIEGTFNKPVNFEQEEITNLFKEHVDFVNEGIAAGRVLLTGPKVNESGGVTFIKAESLEETELFFQGDPLNGQDFIETSIIEFKPQDGQPSIIEWFNR